MPNWASAEEQFIPNYPPQITIYSKFFFENPNFSLSTKFFFLDLSWTYETIKHFHFLNTCFVCCCSPCSRVSLERLISNSRVAFDQAIVIIIIKYHQLSIEAKKINFPETCSKQYQFFSSAKHNYVSMCITVKKKLKKVEKQKNKLALKIVKSTRGSSALKIGKKVYL